MEYTARRMLLMYSIKSTNVSCNSTVCCTYETCCCDMLSWPRYTIVAADVRCRTASGFQWSMWRPDHRWWSAIWVCTTRSASTRRAPVSNTLASRNSFVCGYVCCATVQCSLPHLIVTVLASSPHLPLFLLWMTPSWRCRTMSQFECLDCLWSFDGLFLRRESIENIVLPSDGHVLDIRSVASFSTTR